jgi:hypothetical protein
MKKWKSRMVLGVIAITMALGLTLFPGLVKAVPITLADYIATGSTGVQIDDKLFYGFGYTAAGGAPTAAGITVVQLTTPGNPGLRFVAAWSVGAGESMDSNISYFVKVLPGGAPIVDIGALMAGAGFTGTGRVNLAENVFDAPGDIVGANIANLFLFLDSGGSLLNQEVILANPTLGSIFVVKDIILRGGIEGRAALSFVENTYSEKIPEPISLILLGSGLAGAGLYRRLRKPKG